MRGRRQRVWALVLSASCVAWSAGAAHALELPDASYGASLAHQRFLDPEIHASQSFTGTGDFTLLNASEVQAKVGIEPGAAAEASASADFEETSNASAFVTYYFEITGPTDGVDVPIVVDTVLEQSVTFSPYYPGFNVYGSGNPGYVYLAQARVDVNTGPNTDPSFAEVTCSKQTYADPSCAETPQETEALISAVGKTGVVGRILVSANTMVDQRNAFGVVSAEAFADPMLSFAPGFDATGFSIQLSAGIGNAVPEPVLATLLALALCALGARAVTSRVRRS
jgi:hypothetical protein